ncbi:hypothetical protein MXB_848, partial [Myxobolus squamalis]
MSFSDQKLDKIKLELKNEKKSKYVSKFKSKILRCYPKGSRIKSSNYCPTHAWALGIHMAAMNFQTPDINMQLNHGFFNDNGRSGYILMPKDIIDGNCHRLQSNSLPLTPAFQFKLSHTNFYIICGRNLFIKSPFKNISPYVYVKINGALVDENATNEFSTNVVANNGISPIWNNYHHTFNIYYPELALLHLSIRNSFDSIDSDVIGCVVLKPLMLRE